MTVSRPPESPPSRRAARALREEAERRALESAPIALEPPRTTLPLPIVPLSPASEPTVPPTRHDARAAELLSAPIAPARHARPRRATRAAVAVALAAAGALLVGSSAAMTAMMTETPAVSGSGTAASARFAPPRLPSVAALPVPQVEQAEATHDICALPEVGEALAAGDNEGVITAAGGGEAFRAAVVGGNAPCISLADPARTWVIVNKRRPFTPLEFRPAMLVLPDDVRSLEGGYLRPDAASALTAMVAAARTAGVGEIAMESGFRAYSTQQSSYGAQVSERGAAGADMVSARPGYSEHQSGIAADLVACNGGCGTLDDLAASAQGAWIAAHAWEYGWIVRYEAGHTSTSGYLAEPWHVRFIGPQLAEAYHTGGWHTLEEFFGLDPAPSYIG
ncbi:M15 family metallopeptidase [Microbacterium deminutum]|uniref:M15 family metallopeptidase n=1 Tax=Microbacterium deminutum TaxID=344164 RepID=UPI0031CED15E